MNKRQKPSKPRRGAGITLAVCFVAAAVMVGIKIPDTMNQ